MLGLPFRFSQHVGFCPPDECASRPQLWLKCRKCDHVEMASVLVIGGYIARGALNSWCGRGRRTPVLGLNCVIVD
jgi:hypothetical protein